MELLAVTPRPGWRQ